MGINWQQTVRFKLQERFQSEFRVELCEMIASNCAILLRGITNFEAIKYLRNYVKLREIMLNCAELLWKGYSI